MNNEKPKLKSLPNNQVFYNLLTGDNTEVYITDFFRELKEFPHYDEDFKVFDQYTSTYNYRLNNYLDIHNNHSNELLFIEEELSKLDTLKCFHLKISWEPNLNEFDIMRDVNNLIESEFESDNEELFRLEYSGVIIHIFEYLYKEQLKIIEHLNKIKTFINRKILSDESNVSIEISELKSTITYRLKVLESTGILHFIKEQYIPKNSNSFANLIKKILDLDKGDLKSPMQDFFGNASISNNKDFRRSENDYEDIEQFLDKHFSKRPKTNRVLPKYS
jgi:hypothetical protein